MYEHTARRGGGGEARGGGGEARGACLWLALRNYHGLIPSFAKARGVRRNNSTENTRNHNKAFSAEGVRERENGMEKRERETKMTQPASDPSRERMDGCMDGGTEGRREGWREEEKGCKQWWVRRWPHDLQWLIKVNIQQYDRTFHCFWWKISCFNL